MLATWSRASGLEGKPRKKRGTLAKDIPLAKEKATTTTHFSVIDKDGMAVANTYNPGTELRFPAVMVRGAGFILNNEDDRLQLAAGRHQPKNGTIGTEPNQIAPRQNAMLSSARRRPSSPRTARWVLVTGKSRQPNHHQHGVVHRRQRPGLRHGHPRLPSIAPPRLHHQWFPDDARFEGTSQYPRCKVNEAPSHGPFHQRAGRQGDAHTRSGFDPKNGDLLWARERPGGSAAKGGRGGIEACIGLFSVEKMVFAVLGQPFIAKVLANPPRSLGVASPLFMPSSKKAFSIFSPCFALLRLLNQHADIFARIATRPGRDFPFR